MAHRPRKGKASGQEVDLGRREALTRLVFGATAACAAPVLLTLPSAAEAGVVVGDGDLDNRNDKGKDGNGSTGTGNGHGGYIGQNRRAKPDGDGGRITVQELLEYLANFGKKKK